MVDLSLVAVLITTSASALIGVISQIQHSRCTQLSLCGGFFNCVRKVPDVEEPPIELDDLTLHND